MKLRTGILLGLGGAALIAGATLLPRPSATAQDDGQRARTQARLEARIKGLEGRLGAMEKQLQANTELLELLAKKLEGTESPR